MSRALDFANDISTLESKFSGDTLSNVVIDAGQILGTDIDTLENAGPYIPVNITNPTDTQILAFDNGVLVNQDQVVATSSNVDHDLLTNFVANEHIDWTNATENFSTSGTLGVGSNALVVDASGNVGIGTNTPIADSILVLSKDNNAGLEFSIDNAISGENRILSYDRTSNQSIPFQVNTNVFKVLTDGSPRMYIDSYGNVAIGTTTPVGKFSVSDGTIVGEINPYGPASGCYFGTRTNHSVLLKVNAQEQMRLDTNGKIYIKNNIALGEGAPGNARLDVLQYTTSGGPYIYFRNRGINTTDNTNTYNMGGILASGYRDIADPAHAGAIIFQRVPYSGGYSSAANILFCAQGNGSSGIPTTRMTIDYNGNIGAPTGTNIYNASDERLKQNITELSGCLQKVLSMRGVSFNWLNGFCDSEIDKTMYGLIAQELQIVDSNLVESFSDNPIEVGEVTIETPLRVNEKFIIPMLVESIKEQQTIIESQQSQIDALTARVEALESN